MDSKFKNLNILLDNIGSKDLKDKKFNSLVVPYALTLKPYENQTSKVCIKNDCINKNIYDAMIKSIAEDKFTKKAKKKEKKELENGKKASRKGKKKK